MIPVTVLTGFLGSGKTTLLGRLLKSPEFGRTAVIVNEMGEIGIDHELVETSEESFVTLETGCLCCTIRGDLERTIGELLARRAEGSVPAFERIVIETSGIADPAPILQALMCEAGRGAGIGLERVVTTVDAVSGLATLAREPQSRRQAAIADRLVVTKCDLAGGVPPAELLARLAALNPRAPVRAASFGAIDAGCIVGSGPEAERARDAAHVHDDPASHNAGQALPVHDVHVHPAEGPTSSHAHGADITSLAIRRERPLPAIVLTLFLEALAEQCGDGLLRLKGLVHVAESPDRPAVIHGVQHVFHPPAWLARWPSADRSTRLVLIGRGLSRAWIECLIDALEAEVAEVAVAQTSA